jgi:hypothetical protein
MKEENTKTNLKRLINPPPTTVLLRSNTTNNCGNRIISVPLHSSKQWKFKRTNKL